jgi:cytochrome c oxidase subunit 2
MQLARRDGRRLGKPWAAASLAAALAGCWGPQSSLDAAGRSAEEIAAVFWWMTGGAAAIWLGVVALAVYSAHVAPEPHRPNLARALIVGGGVAFPTIVLAGLLAYGLAILPRMLDPAPAGSLRVQVTGEQWWWRVRYPLPGGGAAELANELRLPVGEPVELELASADVIHSFWVPALAGKMDMIPGRRTRLKLEPTRTGVFRGQCAEYCGGAHAFMAFVVEVVEREAFERWLRAQAAPARAPSDPRLLHGQELFAASGCGACHAVRGTDAQGVIGPDLTHVASRLTLAAARLDNDVASLRAWLAHPGRLKPGVHMPAFGMLPPQELEALAAYLESLE